MKREPRNPRSDKLVNERLISMAYGQIGRLVPSEPQRRSNCSNFNLVEKVSEPWRCFTAWKQSSGFTRFQKSEDQRPVHVHSIDQSLTGRELDHDQSKL